VAEPVLLPDTGGPVAVYGVPYLEPDAVRAELGCDERGHAAVMRAAMAQVRADLARRPAGTRSVVLAHAFVSGGAACDSERDISVGGAGVVPASVFEGISYTALGHLHGAQQVAPGVRYSGSPLAYSFSEEYHRKSVAVVDLEAPGSRRPQGSPRVELVPCPVPRRLRRLHGRLADLLADPKLAECEDSWVAATLTDAVRPRAAMDQLRARFPHTLQLAFEPQGGAAVDRTSYSLRLRGRTDLQIAEEFVTHVRRAAPTAGESLLLRDALEAGRAVAVGAR
jgi:exonuclease SbcD